LSSSKTTTTRATTKRAWIEVQSHRQENSKIQRDKRKVSGEKESHR
jgi:hypothetical protein